MMVIMTRYLCGLLLEECEHVLGHVSHGRRGELAVGAEVGQVFRLVHRVLLHEAVQVVAHQDLGNLERILDKITFNVFSHFFFQGKIHKGPYLNDVYTEGGGGSQNEDECR